MSESTMTVASDGTKRWKNSSGDLHRTDGPAIEWANGDKEWFQNGLRHRVDSPASIFVDGSEYWWQNGMCHRVDGPAVEEANGTKEWWQNGLRHRLDGPAIEWSDGISSWYYNDERLGYGLRGFWALWDLLNDEERQNINMHMWLRKLTND